MTSSGEKFIRLLQLEHIVCPQKTEFFSVEEEGPGQPKWEGLYRCSEIEFEVLDTCHG